MTRLWRGRVRFHFPAFHWMHVIVNNRVSVVVRVQWLFIECCNAEALCCSKLFRHYHRQCKFVSVSEIIFVARRRQWVLHVKRTRARWDFPVVYNASCVLCCDYFGADWFDSSSSVKLSVGYELQHKNVLLNTAVSKIFARSGTLKGAHHKWQVDRGPRPRRIRLPSVLSVDSVTDIDGSTYASGAGRNHQSCCYY